MRPALAWCVAVLAGCGFDPSGVDLGGAAPDANPDVVIPDADPDAPDAACGLQELTFTPANVDPCDLPVSMGDFSFTDDGKHTIDTTSNTIRRGGEVVTSLAHALITQPGTSTQAMVIVADDLEITAGAEVNVSGSRPLIIIALKTLRVVGLIDAGGVAEIPGAGSDLVCTTGAGHDGMTQLGDQTVAIPGGSGGGGGGYATDGGTGGRVSPQASPDPLTPGGGTWGSTIVPFVGGCSGGGGGIAAITNPAAPGGGGGGALELVAGTEVRIDGVVSVSGGGGRGAGMAMGFELSGGGGGGGSGGTLLFQSPMVRIPSGKVTANGGAGGEGRSDGLAGSPGGEGSRITATAAQGGDGVAGGNGGAGGVRGIDPGPGTVGTGSGTTTAGGGGGGGAVGRIVYRATNVSVMGSDVVSPNAVTLPL